MKRYTLFLLCMLCAFAVTGCKQDQVQETAVSAADSDAFSPEGDSPVLTETNDSPPAEMTSAVPIKPTDAPLPETVFSAPSASPTQDPQNTVVSVTKTSTQESAAASTEKAVLPSGTDSDSPAGSISTETVQSFTVSVANAPETQKTDLASGQERDEAGMY